VKELQIIFRGEKTLPLTFAFSELEKALAYQNISYSYANYWDAEKVNLLVGDDSGSFTKRVLLQNNLALSAEPESILLAGAVATEKGEISLALGSDDRGIMYAVLEVAERILANGLEAITGFFCEAKTPSLRIRTLGRFIMSFRDDEWFFSEEFWHYYIARLAKNRVNRLQIITGFDTALFSPPYAFLVEVPGFEEVTVDFGVEDNQAQRLKTRDMLRKIIEICHSYSVDFCFGIWQHQPWTDNQKSLVRNMPSYENFAKYCAAGLLEMLRQCPGIDALSFRVNLESGMSSTENPSSTNESFWYGIFDAVKNSGQNITLELRAKGLTDTMIDYVLNLGLEMNIPTKAWCEHVGLPYQMLQMRAEELENIDDLNSTRRYSYDDMLRKPRSVDVQYRLWNYGTTNLFLWGDPAFASRFVKSCVDLEAIGFEFTAPLSLKGGHSAIDGDTWPIHIHPDMLTYKWEDERYWMWYLSFGRMGYDPEDSEEVWKREFRVRFGKYADDMEKLYLFSGKILPLITTAHFPVHPSMHYWPEIYSGAALFFKNNYDPKYVHKPLGYAPFDVCYANALPSDEALFCSIERFVEGEIEGEVPRCYSPLLVREWYRSFAQNVRQYADKLEINGAACSVPEIKASLVDFKMIAELGDFHAWKIGAAYFLCRFQKTDNTDDLLRSYSEMKAARECFSNLSDLGDMYYAPDLVFDAGTSLRRNGTWRDRITNEIDIDIADLKEMILENNKNPEEAPIPMYRSLYKGNAYKEVKSVVPKNWTHGEDLPVQISIEDSAMVSDTMPPFVHYRHINLREGEFLTVPMKREGNSYTATVPGNYLTPAFDLYVYFSIPDQKGQTHIHPGVYHPAHVCPAHIIRIE